MLYLQHFENIALSVTGCKWYIWNIKENNCYVYTCTKRKIAVNTIFFWLVNKCYFEIPQNYWVGWQLKDNNLKTRCLFLFWAKKKHYLWEHIHLLFIFKVNFKIKLQSLEGKKLNWHLKEIESIYNFTFLMLKDILE